MNRPRLVRALQITWSVACGIACLLLCLLWVRSYWVWDNLGTAKTPITHEAISIDGRVIYAMQGAVNKDQREWYHLSQPSAPMSPFRFPSYLGFYVEVSRLRWVLSMPYWFLAALATTLSIFAWTNWCRRFSLRTLLIALTLVGLGLGLVAWLNR